jgi:putative DNA primase/helicase
MISIENIERQALSFMEQNGITPPRDGLILDGARHRFSIAGKDKGASKSGAYQIYIDGWPAGWVQDFHLGDPIKWRYESDGYQKVAICAARHVEKSEDEKRRQEERRQARENALQVYCAGHPISECADHPYLLAKRVHPVGPLRVGRVPSKTPGKMIDGVLLIPCFDALTDEFIALHRVFPWRDRETGKFCKGWHPGTSGGVFPIAADVQRGPVFVAEGIATALSTYELWVECGKPEGPDEYVPCCTVLAAMDGGNLARQAGAIRRRYADRRLLIVQDADSAGKKAAEAALDAGFDGVIKPPAEGGV